MLPLRVHMHSVAAELAAREAQLSEVSAARESLESRAAEATAAVARMEVRVKDLQVGVGGWGVGERGRSTKREGGGGERR
jgi:L-rhamnose isomerase